MRSLKHLNKYFLKYKYRLLLGVLIAIIAKALALEVPKIVNDSIDVVSQFKAHKITNIDVVKVKLINNILLIIGASVLSGIFTFIMREAILVTSRWIEFDLKNEIYNQYQKLSLSFYKKNRIGDLMNRISEDVSKVRMYLGPAVLYAINLSILFSIAIWNMIHINKTLTLYTLLPIPVLSTSIYYLSKIINKRSTIVQQYLSSLTALAQEKFSGISIIKGYQLEENTKKEFEELADIYKEKNISLYKAQALFLPLMTLLVGISNILVIYIGGLLYIKGSINLGVIAEFIIYVNMLTWPVTIIGWIISTVEQAEASQRRINEFLHETPEIKNPLGTKKQIQGDIEFINVSHTYKDTMIKALDQVSFNLKKGTTLAVLGETGSGKSTILQMIARLTVPSKGTIKIDGIDISKINLKNLRESIGFVPQEALLFSDTIKNNIKFGDKNANDTSIIEMTKNTHIHNNIEDFKEGYSTLVGERGVTLSGGEKQRISIARALIKDPKILIFDDCLSAVDTKTEEIILKNLKKITTGKTTLIVSHRISSIKNADYIILLKKGKIVQHGKHNKLISTQGFYRDLYKQQILKNRNN